MCKVITNKLDDCSSPVQLCHLLEKYEDSLYRDDVYKAFLERILFILKVSETEVEKSMCKRLLEQIEDSKIISVAYRELNGDKSNKIKIEIEIDSSSGKVLTDVIDQLVRTVLSRVNGNKREASEILGIKVEDITSTKFIKKELSDKIKRKKERFKD
jgi:DNA-binding protein Fis